MNYLNQNNIFRLTKRDLLISVIFFLLGSIFTYSLNKPQTPQIQSVETTNTEVSKPLGFLTSINSSKGLIRLSINQAYISFNPYESAINNNVLITIKNEDYPKLFKQGIANSSLFQAEEYIDPQTKEIFIKLSNNQPDHGGYASTYVLLINPFTGEIKEGENDYQLEGK